MYLYQRKEGVGYARWMNFEGYVWFLYHTRRCVASFMKGQHIWLKEGNWWQMSKVDLGEEGDVKTSC